MPGMEIPQWFRPIKTGTWQIICAQLCGASHSLMKAKYVVEEQKDFDAWYKGQLEMTQGYLKKQAEEIAKKAPLEKPAPHGEKKAH